MAAFIVSTVSIHDAERFKAYASGIQGLAERHGGEYVVRGAVTDMLEGRVSPGERVVVVRFPDEAAARGYIASQEYQAAKAVRGDAADVSMRLLVE